ncbi:MAG: hypothetical protein ACJ76H_17185 [Bacteriovoracaceae bacterium]
MKTLLLAVSLGISLSAFATLETGTFSCDNGAELDIYKHSSTFYSSFLIYPSGSGWMSALDSIEFNGDSGVMYNDEMREIGQANVTDEGKRLFLLFHYSEVTCVRD